MKTCGRRKVLLTYLSHSSSLFTKLSLQYKKKTQELRLPNNNIISCVPSVIVLLISDLCMPQALQTTFTSAVVRLVSTVYQSSDNFQVIYDWLERCGACKHDVIHVLLSNISKLQ